MTDPHPDWTGSSVPAPYASWNPSGSLFTTTHRILRSVPTHTPVPDVYTGPEIADFSGTLARRQYLQALDATRTPGQEVPVQGATSEDAARNDAGVTGKGNEAPQSLYPYAA